MRLLTAIFAVAVVFSIESHGTQLPRSIRNLIPATYDLTKPEYASARSELLAEVKQCGPGVVKGALDEQGNALRNSCTYQIELDELFFTDIKNKTGLLHDSEWPYQEGENWYVAKADELPEKYDIRDLMKNGMPDLRQQQCGDCWAWASHHGLELARAVYDQKVYDHSVQTIVSCSGHGSCSGGYMSAPTWLVKRGLPYEEDFKYAASNAKCKFSKDQMNAGWDAPLHDAPNIGSSLDYSRYFKDTGFREGNKVKNIMAAVMQAKSPAVVTVSAYSVSGDGVYNSCGAINSGGNHMVTIVGWDTDGGTRNAHVWNSWGKSHGKDGVSRIKWECGDGKLNRGLGVSARIIHYMVPCEMPVLDLKTTYRASRDGKPVRLGKKMRGVECKWIPSEGLSSPNACETEATPKMSTEYHLQVTSACGTKSAMTVVQVLQSGGTSPKLMTPFGVIEQDEESLVP